jgi:hypothetical protein
MVTAWAQRFYFKFYIRARQISESLLGLGTSKSRNNLILLFENFDLELPTLACSNVSQCSGSSALIADGRQTLFLGSYIDHQSFR